MPVAVTYTARDDQLPVTSTLSNHTVYKQHSTHDSAFYMHNQTPVGYYDVMQPTSNQLVDEEWPTGLLVNQTKADNLNIRDVTRNMVTEFNRFQPVKAKFHYASWFEAGRRQVRSWSATSFDQLRTS